MKIENIIRAWKDEAYRSSLSEAERAQIPENPAGFIELDDAALGGASGGAWVPATYCTCSWVCTYTKCPAPQPKSYSGC